MKVSNKQIKNLLQPQNALGTLSGTIESQEKIDICVTKSKQIYCEHETQGYLTKMEFLYQQSRYILKRWWVLQGLLLLALWWVLKNSNSPYFMQRSMGTAAPLLVVLMMPEFWKNRHMNAMEIECTSYFSLRRVYAARLILFASVDLILLSTFSLTAVHTTQLSLWELMIQFILPFNVTCCICFQTLYHKWFRSEIFSMFLCMLWSAAWILIVLNTKLYGMISEPIWYLLLIMSTLYLGYCIYRGQRRCNEIWESDMVWNEE
ncbi:MAG: hypothetical protein J1F18_07390 [Lachnospiraceae bacterium]|nr:hypothetical protein [Lachnospiraceae bacterium]